MKSLIRQRTLIASEEVVDQLIQIKSKYPDIVDTLLSDFYGNGRNSKVYQLKGIKRPIWKANVFDDLIICFTIGVGEGQSEEIRIVYLGPEEKCPDFIDLAFLSTEVNSINKSLKFELIDKKNTSKFPVAPSALIDENIQYLDKYLKQNLENRIPDQTESLYGSRFRKIGKSFPLLKLGSHEDLPLRLGPKQLELLDAKCPLLLQGVAGSGKTTVVIYSAVRRSIESNGSSDTLIVVYQKELKAYVEALLYSLSGGEPEKLRISVLTYRELCDTLFKNIAGDIFNWAEFDLIYNSLRYQRKEMKLSKKIRIPEILEEIRACIKGISLDPQHPLIDYDCYMNYENRSLHVPGSIKEKIYQLALEHQTYLAKNHFCDDMDAAQILLSFKAQLKKWKHVFVDEVQDYTLVQLVLLSSIADTPEGLFFAGDEHQVVYASQFSWSRVKSAIELSCHRSQYYYDDLNVNYRNTKSIIALSNSLLKHRKKKLGLRQPELPHTNQPITPMPLRIVVPRKRLRQLIGNIASKIPSLGIIFPSQIKSEKNRWSLHGISLRRNFFPQSVKGLEFEIVCLIGFGQDFLDLDICKPIGSNATEMFRFNQVYVSLTRARRLVVLIDTTSKHPQLWDNDLYDGCYEICNSEKKLYKKLNDETATTSEMGWKLSAMDFERQEAYGAAAECWQRAEHWIRAGWCLKKIDEWDEAIKCYNKVKAHNEIAKIHENFKRYSKAAKYWELMGDWENAACCWEESKTYDRAVNAWKRTQNKLRTIQAKAMLYEQEFRFERAYSCWLRLGEFKKAAENIELSGKFSKALPLWKKLNNSRRYDEAKAQLLEQKNEHKKASDIWINLKKWRKAAENLDKIEKYKESAELWQRSGDEVASVLSKSLYLEKIGHKDSAYNLRSKIENRIWELYKIEVKNAWDSQKEARRFLHDEKNPLRSAKFGGMSRRRGKPIKHKKNSISNFSHHIDAAKSWEKAAAILQSALLSFENRGIYTKHKKKWLELSQKAINRSQLNFKRKIIT